MTSSACFAVDNLLSEAKNPQKNNFKIPVGNAGSGNGSGNFCRFYSTNLVANNSCCYMK